MDARMAEIEKKHGEIGGITAAERDEWHSRLVRPATVIAGHFGPAWLAPSDYPAAVSRVLDATAYPHASLASVSTTDAWADRHAFWGRHK